MSLLSLLSSSIRFTCSIESAQVKKKSRRLSLASYQPCLQKVCISITSILYKLISMYNVSKVLCDQCLYSSFMLTIETYPVIEFVSR